MTTIEELQDRIKKFCDERDWEQYHNAKDLAIGIITEAGELLHNLRFKSNEEVDEILKNPEKRQEISGELADILYFVLRLAQKYDIDIAVEFERKMQKNEKRYPINKAKGLNKKYDE